MKVKVSIPSNASEIKLKDYQRYIKATEDNEDEHFLTLKLIEIFTGLTLAQVNAMPLNDIEEIANVILKALNEQPKFQRIFELNGKRYGFIPNLDEISAGEYGDLTSYLQNIEDLHKAMAVLYRPITKEKGELYSIEPYEGSSKYSFEMKHAPMDIVISSQVFFYNLGRELTKHILLYLEKETKKDPTLQNLLEKNGVGTDFFTQLQEGMLLNSIKLPNLDYINS